MNVVTTAEMRRIENSAIFEGAMVDQLMARAGRAIAKHVSDAIGGRIVGRNIAILAGPGNNGGDGLIAARLLRQRGADVVVTTPLPRPESDDLLPECVAAGCRLLAGAAPSALEELAGVLNSADIVVDALLGTGMSRRIEGPTHDVLAAVDRAKASSRDMLILAADLPSGLNADTGDVDPATLRADITVALGLVKRGCLTAAGAMVCGAIRIADIGLGAFSQGGVELLSVSAVRNILPERELSGHKGTFGHALIVGGAPRYRGAPALAARAAARSGAGVVSVAAPGGITNSIAPMIPEATHVPLAQNPDMNLDMPEALSQLQEALAAHPPEAIAIGPGLGRDAGAGEVLMSLVLDNPDLADTPVVLDADALTLLSATSQWWERLSPPAILTPHPGEMSRLVGVSTAQVQYARLEIAADKAREWGVTVVLKGAYTVIAEPDGRASICPIALPALASGGTGDALTGVIAGFLAQGLSIGDAARAGVYIHGVAGALAAASNGDGMSGMLASDLIDHIPAATGLIRRGDSPPPPIFA